MTSPKYPNWKIEKQGTGYIMSRPDWEEQEVSYLIIVSKDSRGWFAELLTQRQDQYSETGWSWEAARNECHGEVAEVVKETEQRAAYWMTRN